jgi:branched-chain amino acid transport system permease protein
MMVILFFRNGLMGTREFNWDKIISFFSKNTFKRGGKKDATT